LDKTARLWDLEGRLLKTLEGHTNYVNSVSFSPDGKTIATASWDKTARLWSLDGTCLQVAVTAEEKGALNEKCPDPREEKNFRTWTNPKWNVGITLDKVEMGIVRVDVGVASAVGGVPGVWLRA